MSLEHLIEKSSVGYQGMLDHLAIISGMLKGAHPTGIGQALEHWHSLLQETRQLDTRIDQHRSTTPQNNLLPRFEQRTELMRQVALQCQQVYSQANLLKAMVSDELNKLQHGRKALGGYKGSSNNKGSRLTASL
ncbi:MAG: hypothetical protein BA869_02605 [Desulfuromonadales bacterium C00003107]|jgi:hypothetical protein|nr:MAG: hypothetical protein BA869_02605 [Desulfuromonadales bacterium C00003107]